MRVITDACFPINNRICGREEILDLPDDIAVELIKSGFVLPLKREIETPEAGMTENEVAAIKARGRPKKAE